jgi:hypothetical protein
MLGGRTPRRESYKPVRFHSNCRCSTTCQMHMPHVAAYVVGHVEGLVLCSTLAEASTRPRRGFWHSEQTALADHVRTRREEMSEHGTHKRFKH